MTDKQPDALRLADLADAEYWPSKLSLNEWASSVANLLRTQHAEIEQLAQARADLEAEVIEQARIVGMGAERELALMGRVEGMEAKITDLETMNAQLREQNTEVDAACAKLEAENQRLRIAGATSASWVK